MSAWLRCALAFLALAVAASAAPPAVAQRTFVSTLGNDANPCTLVLPCRSFGAAIALTPPDGEVIALNSGGYGPVTITQSVSIIAPAGVYAGISVIAPTNTVGVWIGGAGIKVVLQNIAINALGGTYGIQVLQAAEVDVEGCTISNFVGAGIYSGAANWKLNVRDTLIRDNNGPGAVGVYLFGSMRAVFERVRVVRNTGNGITADRADVTVKRSVVAGNGGSGIVVGGGTTTGAVATVEDSLIADNGGDGLAVSSSSVGSVNEASATRNTITRNTRYGVSVFAVFAGSSIVSLSDNLISQQGLDGVFATGNSAGGVVTANNNTFAGNGTSALHAIAPTTIHTITGADGLPNNSGEQTTPTIGAVVPTSAF